MLVEFRVKNFGCLRDETALSFLPTKSRALWETNVYQTNVPLVPQLLRTALLYGANGSGKSTLLYALQTMQRFIGDQLSIQSDSQLPYTPFLYSQEDCTNPTAFECSFLHENCLYQFGFSYNKDRILEEYLFYYPENRKRTLFTRTYDSKIKKYIYKFGKYFHGHKKLLYNYTHDSMLFLCTAKYLNNTHILSIWNTLSTNICIITKYNKPNINYINKLLFNNTNIQKQICSFLKSIDTETCNIEINKFISYKLLGNEEYKVYFYHKNNKNKTIKLYQEDESDGTLQLYIYLPYILQALEKGYLLAIDDLDTNIHPLIMRHIVDIFQTTRYDTHGAQLLFTSHDVSLMENNPEILRRDQIWFVDKSNDQASSLYSLTEFRNVKDVFRSYLHGRLGAIPVLYGWNYPPEV